MRSPVSPEDASAVSNRMRTVCPAKPVRLTEAVVHAPAWRPVRRLRSRDRRRCPSGSCGRCHQCRWHVHPAGSRLEVSERRAANRAQRAVSSDAERGDSTHIGAVVSVRHEELRGIGRAEGAAEGGKALGTIATDAELKTVFDGAGFRAFRRATETPTNRVFEAKP